MPDRALYITKPINPALILERLRQISAEMQAQCLMSQATIAESKRLLARLTISERIGYRVG